LFLPEKVQEEIGRTVKAGSWVTYEDRKNMPFTNAVIHEVQRFITLLPHVPRCTAVDTHFRGYFLPKVGTAQPRGTPCSSCCQRHYRPASLEGAVGQKDKIYVQNYPRRVPSFPVTVLSPERPVMWNLIQALMLSTSTLQE